MITRFLVLVNIVAFLWELRVGGFGVLSGNANIDPVLQAASLYPAAVLEGGQWWRIITGGFLHGSLMHIAINMFSLYWLGRFIESATGPIRMIVIYFASLIASGLAVIYFSPPDVPTVGASGAIFGLFGALFAIGFKFGPRGMDLIRSNVGILVANLVFTFVVPGISWQAHVGGLIAGFIVTYLIYFPPRAVQPMVIDAATGDALETEYEAPKPS